MANPTRKEYPIRKYVGFSDEQWKPLRKWIRAQRPRISEAEGLRRLVTMGMEVEAQIGGFTFSSSVEPSDILVSLK